MKPDWKDAPEWAQWLAMDDNGEWNWYEREPAISDLGPWWANYEGESELAEAPLPEWTGTAEPRPPVQTEPTLEQLSEQLDKAMAYLTALRDAANEVGAILDAALGPWWRNEPNGLVKAVKILADAYR